MKSIMNALTWLILISTLAISGCATNNEVISQPIERIELKITDPAPLKVNPPKWIVVTPENVESVFNELKQSNSEVALIAITPQGYTELSLTLKEVRDLIQNQKLIIQKYREYYGTGIKKTNPN